MKRRFWLLLAVLVLTVSLLALPAAAADTLTADCEFCGKIATVNGSISPVAGYLQATEAGGISFHAYKMEITGMTLRAAEAGYTLYATIMGLEQPAFRLSDIKLNEAGGWELPKKITLSDSDKLVIQECVNNALDTPFQVTASQYPAK